MKIFNISVCILLLLLTACSGDENINQERDIEMDKMFEPLMNDMQAMLIKADLGDYWGVLKQHIRPGFYMVSKPMDEEQIKIGTSKIGGRPDVPSAFEWPYWKDRPMSFIAQINLEEFPMSSVDPNYPASGILYFFYVYDMDLWYENNDYDSDDRNNNFVYYTTDTSQLIRIEPPKELTEEQIFKPGIIEKKMELTIPDSDYLVENKLLRNKEDLRKYSLEFHTNYLNTYGVDIGFRFLGHMTALQYGGHPKDDILLFQADSNYEIGMEWDMSGLLYFFMKKDDFEKLFFDDVYTVRVGT